jgi:hypothetical protein
MTALQSIIKEAKSLRAKYPKRFSKWTDYVKQASAIYASKHKGKSPVGKKKVVKKKITKKKVVKKTIAKKPTEKVILKKVHAAKKTSKNLFNKLDKLDEAQHDHMMGKKIGSILQKHRQDFIDLLKQIEFLESEKRGVIFDKKNYILKHGKKYYDWYLNHTNKWIRELKTHKNEIYKLL